MLWYINTYYTSALVFMKLWVQASANSDGPATIGYRQQLGIILLPINFCGEALTSTLHARYKKQNTHKPAWAERVHRQRIKIIQCLLKYSDKAHIPCELQYRDWGYMYFPSGGIFVISERGLKEVDTLVLENTNKKKLYNSMVLRVEITAHQLTANQTAEDKFKTLVFEYWFTARKVQAELTSVYCELTRNFVQHTYRTMFQFSHSSPDRLHICYEARKCYNTGTKLNF